MDRTIGELRFDTEVLARHWWAIALRGLAAVIFGILAFVMPGVTLAVLVLLFGAYALVDGIFNIIAAISGRTGPQSWWMVLLEGLVSVAAGLVTFFMPGLTALTLVYIISAWAIITGVLEIVAAIRLRKEITNEWWLVLSGVLSVVFGGLIAAYPGAGALALIFWIGAYAVVFGVFLLALAFRLRRRHSDTLNEPIRRAA